MIHEYPLDGNRPWCTCLKIRKANELLLQRRSRNDYKVSNLSTEEQQQIQDTISLLASKGYRILGVYSNYTETNYPQNQQDLSFHFVGLVVFYDLKTEHTECNPAILWSWYPSKSRYRR
jgi:Ca2+-transporting ATPase